MFDQIPGNLVAPIVTFEVSSGGAFENDSRLLLIGFKNTGADLADNTPTPCPTTSEARRLAGAGSMLDDMVRLARRNAPAQEIWIVSPAPVGTANVRTITVAAPPAAGGVGTLAIAGEPVQVTIAAGASAATVASALADAINAYYNPLNEASLPLTAAVADDVVTVTARHAGAHGAGVDLDIPSNGGANAFTGILTVATTTAGAGAPDLAGALAALGDEPFDWIVSAFDDDTNLTRLKTLLEDTDGRWAWSRQIYGHAFTARADSVANLTTHGLAQDNRHVTVLPLIANGGHAQPIWQWAAGFAARAAVWLSDGATGNVSRNQTGLVVSGLVAPRDRTRWLDYATRDAFLRSGLSTWAVKTDGSVAIDKLITTHRTTNGVTDTTFRDLQKIGQLMYALRKFRARLLYEHGQKAIADDNPSNSPAISTVLDIKATFLHAYAEMVATGVLENEVAAADRIVVQRNADNANRVDILAPLDMVNPLDIIAANARVYSQFSA